MSKRKHHRLPLKIPCAIQGDADRVYQGTTDDLSFGGVGLSLHATPSESLPQNLKLTLMLPAPQNEVHFQARVTRQNGPNLSLQFVDMNFADYDQFRRFLLEQAETHRPQIEAEVEKNPAWSRQFTTSFAGKPLGELVHILYGVPKPIISQLLHRQRDTGEKLGTLLLQSQVVTPQQLDAALELTRVTTESTLFSHVLFRPLHPDKSLRFIQLFTESAGLVIVGMWFVLSIGLQQQAGLMGLFLVAAALSARFESLLKHSYMWREVLEIMAIFLGLFGGFVLVTQFLTPRDMESLFGFVLEVANLDPKSTIFERNFSNLISKYHNNSLVMLSVIVFAFVYRGFGVLLVLSWNACVWGLTLSILVGNSIAQHDISAGMGILTATMAVSPHLLLEALAYITGAVAGVELSKALIWYSFGSRRLLIETAKGLIKIVLAFALLLCAAAIESHWAPWLLERA